MATRQVEVRGLEATLLAKAHSSERRAWACVVFSGFVSLVSLTITWFVIHRYSEPIPEHILTLNKDTGVAELVSLLPQVASYDEVITNYWLSRYVVSRESYNFMDVNQDYEEVGLMSSRTVGQDYAKFMLGAEGPEKKWADHAEVSVSIKSVISDTKHQTATVRYSTTLRHFDRDQAEPSRYWIASLGYEFVNQTMTVAQRRLNPLGFKVTSFRSVEENADRVGD